MFEEITDQTVDGKPLTEAPTILNDADLDAVAGGRRDDDDIWIPDTIIWDLDGGT